jgi:PAS domain S-box-containing protein
MPSSRSSLLAEVRSWSRAPGGTALLASLLWGGALVALAAFRPGDDRLRTLLLDLTWLWLPALATSAAWRAARHPALSDATRRAWRRLAGGFAVLGAANVLWLVADLSSRVTPALSWVTSLSYLLILPPLLWGVLSFPRAARGRGELGEFWADTAIVLVGGAIVGWHFVLSPAGAAAWSDLPNAAYWVVSMIGDLVLLAAVSVIILRQHEEASREALAILGAALLVLAFADVGVGVLLVSSGYETGRWPDLLYFLAYLLMAASAHHQWWRAERGGAATRAVGRHSPRLLPIGALAVTYGIVLLEGRARLTAPLDVLLVGAVAVSALVVARLVITGREAGRLRAERAATAAESRFRALIEHASDLVAILDGEGRMSYTSPAHERVLGYAPGALDGRLARDLVHPDDLHAAREAYAVVVGAARRQRLVEFRYRHADGSWRRFEAIFTNLIGEPAIGGVVINSRDITEQTLAESRLREREAQLLQAQKMEAVGRLAGGIAHDFNNVLTAITCGTELLLAELDPRDPRHGEVAEIGRAADRAASLTRQLLAFSRKQLLQPRVIDLGDVVSGMELMLRRLVAQGIELDVRADPRAPALVLADRGQIEQVIVNLALNARDAMADGGCLTIETACVELAADAARPGVPAGRWATLAVRDSGIGMDAETRGRLFEPFFTTKPQGKGTGLGLSSAYGIVAQSGGHIVVDSAPGAGTTITIHLPLVEEAAPRPSSGRATPPRPAPPMGSGRVLLVEDEDSVRLAARRILERHGYDVVAVGDAAAALAALADGVHPDVVLTDVVMPGMSGLALAARLAAQHPELPVVLMSGHADEAALQEALAAGDHAFVQKPFSVTALLGAVAEARTAKGGARYGD